MASDQARMLEFARSEPVWPRPPLWSMGLGVAVAAFLLAYPFVFTSPFSHHLMILILLYALMAQSWNVVAGLSGQISLGHAIFFGIGAYSVHRPVREVRHHALDRPGRRHGALGARRRRHRRADAAPARATTSPSPRC